MSGDGGRDVERAAFGGRGVGVAPVRTARPHAARDRAERPPERQVRAREQRDWAYLGLLAFTAVLFLRPQDAFPPLEALHLAELFAFVGLGSMINVRLARHEPLLPVMPQVMGVIGFFVVMIALVPFSIWPGGSVTMLTGLYIKVVLIFVLMAGTLTTGERLDRFVWLIVIASGYLGFRGMVDYARGVNLVENGRIAGAVGGVFSNPNDLALNMVAFLSPALLLAARRGPPGRRLLAGLMALFMFVAIVFTKSRGGFLGLGAMLLVLLVQGRKVRRGFGAALVVGVLVATPFLPASFWDRMVSITNPGQDETGSREARKIDMREAWRAFLDRPLTGVGPGEFTDYNPSWRQERWREAHNVWLQVAADDGIFGLFAFAYLVAAAFRAAFGTSRLLAKRREAPGLTTDSSAEGQGQEPSRVAGFYATAMTASLAGWFVCSMFASVAYTWTFYYVSGIAMAAMIIARRRNPSASHSRAARRNQAAAA